MSLFPLASLSVNQRTCLTRCSGLEIASCEENNNSKHLNKYIDFLPMLQQFLPTSYRADSYTVKSNSAVHESIIMEVGKSTRNLYKSGGLYLRHCFCNTLIKRFEIPEQQLSFKQIAALRFAGDNELIPLTDKMLAENLQPDEIKKLIRDWQADHMRV